MFFWTAGLHLEQFSNSPSYLVDPHHPSWLRCSGARSAGLWVWVFWCLHGLAGFCWSVLLCEPWFVHLL